MQFVEKAKNYTDVVEWRMHVEKDVVKLYAQRQDGTELCICSICPTGLYRHIVVNQIFTDACDDAGRIKDISNESDGQRK